ncbi:hypothetical protein SAMN05444008_101389 [Cnuella takakiae]|uniref:Uncharacterized protein n=1 Tax=Cnuella takakiae TaxID=1302690 RepID=A0A1M4TDI4_9BACT|nr:hypothetical protein [Cnuella takakiae]OLY90716.1 hypothetical protein BUE76_01490 [Cnuella takakiae]SHE42531.1 hypothetical protein SAMN05444008_101389 [Cnuella takakiae]
MKPTVHRPVIYPKDIMKVTGRSERGSRKMLAAIRTRYNKHGNAFVTVEEFCRYTGIPEDLIIPFLE